MITREEAKEMFRSDKDAFGKPRGVMKKIDAIYDSIDNQLNKANSLLSESINHLDRDFNWEKADAFERKVKIFLKK